MTIRFWVPGDPLGAPRPRSRIGYKKSVAVGEDGKSTIVETPVPVVYKSKRDREWRKTFAFIAAMGVNRPRAPIEGPMRFTMIALMPRPQCYSRRCDPDGLIYAPSNANDWDNLGKGPCDELKGLGYWHDDRQVCDARVVKLFHAKGGEPGAMFVIETLAELPRDLPPEVPGVGPARGAQLDLLAGGARSLREPLADEEA